MKRVVRLVSALGAGASLVWGLARSVRGKREPEAPDPTWPPKPAEPVAKPAAKAAKPSPKKSPAKVETKPVAPKKADASKKAVAPKKTAAPKKAPVKQPEPAEELVLKGVVIEDPAKLVSFVNGVSEEALLEAGIKGKALAVVLASRPFKTAEALGGTAGIGRRTLQTLCAAVDS